MDKKASTFLVMLLMMIFLPSCGGGPVGFASVQNAYIDADVISGTVISNGVCSNPSPVVNPTSTTVTITVLPASSSGGKSPTGIQLKSATITFTPADANSPPLPPQPAAVPNTTIPYGTSPQFSIEVASRLLKESAPLNTLICSGTEFKYYATISFTAIDFDSGNDAHIDPVSVNVRFADFNG